MHRNPFIQKHPNIRLSALLTVLVAICMIKYSWLLMLRLHILLEGVHSALLALSMWYWRWRHWRTNHKLYGNCCITVLSSISLLWYLCMLCRVLVYEACFFSGFTTCSTKVEVIWGAEKMLNWGTWTPCRICFELWIVFFPCGIVAIDLLPCLSFNNSIPFYFL